MTLALHGVGLAASGLVVGSFVTTAAIRHARGEQFLTGRSHCDGCGAPLGLAATLPMASYLIQLGGARCCDARINPLHPLGEMAGLVIFVLAGLAGDLAHGVLLALIGFSLLALALIDRCTGLLPDPLVASTAVFAALLASLGGGAPLSEGVVVAAATFVLLEGVRRLYRLIRGHGGLGGGDVKLLTALAVWLGVLTPAALALAALLGLLEIALMRPRDGRIAFGPALAVSGFAFGAASVIGVGR